jgi:large subunit ribosomal protein L6
MSRVGKEPIKIPAGVKVTAGKKQVSAEKAGTKGNIDIPDGINVEIKESQVNITRDNNSGKLRSLHGLIRSLLSNLVNGLDKAFSKELQIIGRGKKAKSKGYILEDSLIQLSFPYPKI